ncbi:hypothetical protein [Endozoicomonas sp.]|uniref:hypothetical protein n=1 Tax=Endozoicomonas sp. TaxID=1892382 RepID=UPI002887D188|nr:hypothetical protein [Endozoicomonas sp.]
MHTSFSTGIRSKNTLPLAAPSPLTAVKYCNRNTRPFFKSGTGWQQRLGGKEFIHLLNHQMLRKRSCKVRPNPQQLHHPSTNNRNGTVIIASILNKIARLAHGTGALAVKLVILSTMVASSTASHINDTTPAISTANPFTGDMLNTHSETTQPTVFPNSVSPDTPAWQHVLWGLMIFGFICLLARLVVKSNQTRHQTHVELPGGIRMKLTAKTWV